MGHSSITLWQTRCRKIALFWEILMQRTERKRQVDFSRLGGIAKQRDRRWTDSSSLNPSLNLLNVFLNPGQSFYLSETFDLNINCDVNDAQISGYTPRDNVVENQSWK
jgi:hypothetical protein